MPLGYNPCAGLPAGPADDHAVALHDDLRRCNGRVQDTLVERTGRIAQNGISDAVHGHLRAFDLRCGECVGGPAFKGVDFSVGRE